METACVGRGSDFPSLCRNPPPKRRAFVALQASCSAFRHSPWLVGGFWSSSRDCPSFDQGMVLRTNARKARANNLAKAHAACASKLSNFHGSSSPLPPACVMHSRLPFQHFVVGIIRVLCPDDPQFCDLCKPFFTCFRLVFRPPSLFCRRCWLTFAIVCSTGGNDAATRPPESTPTQNVQKKGENSDLSPFSPVFGLFFALPPFWAAAAGSALQLFRSLK